MKIAAIVVAALLAAGCAGDKDAEPPAAETAAAPPPEVRFDETAPMTGMYSYMAEAAMFVECRTGRRFPVAAEGDNAALEGAYLAELFVPGDPLLAVVEARVDKRPRMEGPGEEDQLIVETFLEIRPAESCDGPLARVDLTAQAWRLIELNGQAVAIEGSVHPPYLEFSPALERVVGLAACNRFGGPYEVDGNDIRFVNVAILDRPCEKRQFEADLMFMFDDVRRFRIVGETLELYDAATLRARFEVMDHSGHSH